MHAYETNFHVREAVLSGWPGYYGYYKDTADPSANNVYLDYGLITTTTPSVPYDASWTIPTPTVNPTTNSKTVFEYVNTANPLPITDWAFTTIRRDDNTGPRDLTIPSVTMLLQTPITTTTGTTGTTETKGGALVSVIQYKNSQQAVTREVLLSTISNTWFLTHSQVLSYEFINWVTQGVFVGGRFVYMTNHLDDLFLENELWDVSANKTNPLLTYRLNSADISNAVSKQKAFRASHPTAGTAFKLDFAFNGAGAVVDPLATTLVANKADDLVAAVIANKSEFRFINHTFTHADMDKVPVPANPNCDYPTLATTALIQAEITKNRTVWTQLALPEQSANNRVLVTGNHSGLKDRKCTDYPELHPEMANVQSDDVPFVTGANPLFVTAAANAGVDYIASDTSQLNQDIEQFFTVSKNKVVLTTSNTARTMSPRFPTSVFYNVTKPDDLVDEYNYIFHDRFTDPCKVAGAICTTRNYPAILEAEATAAVRHMLSFKKYPHFFHQGNVAKYDTNGDGIVNNLDDGSTLQFDWLNSVFTAYEKLFKLPVKNDPYYLIGDKTKDSLTAKSATIKAVWNRDTNLVTVSANKTVPNLLVTGIQGPDIYGGQSIRQISVTTTPKTFTVNQLLTQ